MRPKNKEYLDNLSFLKNSRKILNNNCEKTNRHIYDPKLESWRAFADPENFVRAGVLF